MSTSLIRNKSFTKWLIVWLSYLKYESNKILSRRDRGPWQLLLCDQNELRFDSHLINESLDIFTSSSLFSFGLETDDKDTHKRYYLYIKFHHNCVRLEMSLEIQGQRWESIEEVVQGSGVRGGRGSSYLRFHSVRSVNNPPSLFCNLWQRRRPEGKQVQRLIEKTEKRGRRKGVPCQSTTLWQDRTLEGRERHPLNNLGSIMSNLDWHMDLPVILRSLDVTQGVLSSIGLPNPDIRIDH